ncbi:DUF523 domain-containing protein [Aliishimia ponticola]|uniref:DUF523 domain-containing protein n=1 Tax=Aliishimia ponticola TaxID=2499833 RepID=A0A4S4NCQ4_9RHOB|nr:DUF523 domain-containing protein [Aliishimia ponticola]THH37169.1 DUF523 domain-containing protein [Aliishimia ponticola]
MERILISACLIGQPVRYNGTDKRSGAEAILSRWQEEGRLVPICPELAAGLPVPRPPAEIIAAPDKAGPHPDGADVLARRAELRDVTGADLSDAFRRAADHAARLAARHGCRHAVLTDGSPSCGVTFIHDGTFTGRTVPGFGTTTAALRAAGLTVWPENRIAALDALLQAQISENPRKH